MAGWVLFEQKLEKGEGAMSINVQGWESGIYLIHLNIDGQEQIQKLIVAQE